MEFPLAAGDVIQTADENQGSDIEDPKLCKRIPLQTTDCESEVKSKKLKIETDSISQDERKIDSTNENNENERKEGIGSVVAQHYNRLENTGLAQRNRSRIVHLRSFNNWVKSMLIANYLTKCKLYRPKGDTRVTVLDLGCGKGGDLIKWKIGGIGHLICVDIADVSIKQCQERYQDMKSRSQRFPNDPELYTAEFFAADCTKVSLKDKYLNRDVEIDLVSCQFAFHYCFESIQQADVMLRNISENLKPGGYFIGTMPDAYDIVSRQQKAKSNSFGNDVFRIEFDCDTSGQLPIFGAKYHFYLEGVVNCPEFLVHFPVLVKMASKYGLTLVMNERFEEFYGRMRDPGKTLLGKMQALETYKRGGQLYGSTEDYEHAAQYLIDRKLTEVGTLSKSEWEVTTLYIVFAFEKEDRTRNQ